MKNNPFKTQRGILPSYFTGRENELNTIFESTRMGIPNHLLLYGQEGVGKTSLLLKFEENISNFDDVYSIRVPLFDGTFEDIYSLIIEKCFNALDIKISHFWDKITSLGINIPLMGAMSISPDIPQTSPVTAFEKIFSLIYDELDSNNPVLILLFDDIDKISNEGIKIFDMLINAVVELNLQGKNIMIVATGLEDVFCEFESAASIFEPCLIDPFTYDEVCDAINIAVNNIIFEEDVLKGIYELSEAIPYYMQILAYSCFEEVRDNKVTMDEFNNAVLHSINILAQHEFRALFSKATGEERKILCLMAESEDRVFSYSYIKNNANLNSEPSGLLKSLVKKNMLIKLSRGKYKLKDNLFKLYLKNLGINQETGLV